MGMSSTIRVLDGLYGEVILPGPLADLVCTPAVQRLRDVRLSNIDSLSMPGIANVSRYEHAIGAAYLASQVGFIGHLSRDDALVLQAAALLHDSAITAFGHLVEEALYYASAQFNHEMKLSMLLQNPSEGELGGIDLQLYAGRESGIRGWAEETFGIEAEDHLAAITAAMRGKGRFGPCIAGKVDLDNLDNLTRIAFHMGLEVDRSLPVQIASRIVGSDEVGGLSFSSGSVELLKQWLELRRKVYSRLMLSRDDFAGKVMLIYAIVTSYTRGYLGPHRYVWTLTDRELLHGLLQCNDEDVVRTVQSWLVHELWPVSDLLWMSGRAPDYASVYRFTEIATAVVGRPCFGYAISDKRTRLLEVRLQSGELVHLGADPNRWVLGVASRKRENFNVEENRLLQQAACEFFNTKCLGKASEPTVEPLPLFE